MLEFSTRVCEWACINIILCVYDSILRWGLGFNSTGLYINHVVASLRSGQMLKRSQDWDTDVFLLNMNMGAMFSSSAESSSQSFHPWLWMHHREIIEMPLKNVMNPVYLSITVSRRDRHEGKATSPKSDTLTCEELQVGKRLRQHPSALFLYR